MIKLDGMHTHRFTILFSTVFLRKVNNFTIKMISLFFICSLDIKYMNPFDKSRISYYGYVFVGGKRRESVRVHALILCSFSSP